MMTIESIAHAMPHAVHHQPYPIGFIDWLRAEMGEPGARWQAYFDGARHVVRFRESDDAAAFESWIATRPRSGV